MVAVVAGTKAVVPEAGTTAVVRGATAVVAAAEAGRVGQYSR